MIVAICAGLFGVLIFGPVGFLGGLYEVSVLYYIGFSGFAICWLAAAIAMLTFATGMATGKYKNLTSRPWREQIW